MRLTKHKNWRRVSSLKNHHSEVTYFVSEEHITCPILKLTGRRPYDCGAFVKEPLNLFFKIVLVHHASV
jgi:hypothetical protein